MMMKREDVLNTLGSVIGPDDPVVFWVAGNRNEWKTLWYRARPGDATMSSLFMGGLTSFAFGLAIALPNRRVVAFDSDGSLLMGSGILCTLAVEQPPNLTVVVFDNEVYEGTGSQPTHTGHKVDLARLAAGAGIPCTAVARDTESLAREFKVMLEDQQTGLLVAKFQPSPPPKLSEDEIMHSDDREDKYRFIRYIERTEGVTIKPAYFKV